jgi:hypothetical protein
MTLQKVLGHGVQFRSNKEMRIGRDANLLGEKGPQRNDIFDRGV